MIGRVARWGIDALVLLFAGYAFVFVPLGTRTAYEHVKAILGTAEAKNAGREMLEAGGRLKERVLGGTPIETRGRPIIPDLRSRPPKNIRLTPADAGPDALRDAL